MVPARFSSLRARDFVSSPGVLLEGPFGDKAGRADRTLERLLPRVVSLVRRQRLWTFQFLLAEAALELGIFVHPLVFFQVRNRALANAAKSALVPLVGGVSLQLVLLHPRVGAERQRAQRTGERKVLVHSFDMVPQGVGRGELLITFVAIVVQVCALRTPSPVGGLFAQVGLLVRVKTVLLEGLPAGGAHLIAVVVLPDFQRHARFVVTLEIF